MVGGGLCFDACGFGCDTGFVVGGIDGVVFETLVDESLDPPFKPPFVPCRHRPSSLPPLPPSISPFPSPLPPARFPSLIKTPLNLSEDETLFSKSQSKNSNTLFSISCCLAIRGIESTLLPLLDHFLVMYLVGMWDCLGTRMSV